MITHNIERLADSEGRQTPRIGPCRLGQNPQDGSPDCYCVAADSTGDGDGDNEGGYRGPTDPGGFDDGELKEIMREFIGTLIGLLGPTTQRLLDVRRYWISRHPRSRMK